MPLAGIFFYEKIRKNLAGKNKYDSIIETYERLYPDGKNIRYIEKTILLSETKDFGTRLAHIKGMMQ